MDHRHTFHNNSMDSSNFRNYRDQNIQNNPRNNNNNRHGNLRSNARMSTRPRVRRDFPPGVLQPPRHHRHRYHHQPYSRNSWRRRPFSGQQHGNRYNPRLNRYNHGWNNWNNNNIDLNSNDFDFSSNSQQLIPRDQQQRQCCCGCSCHNVLPDAHSGISDADQELDTNNVLEENNLQLGEINNQRSNRPENNNVIHLQLNIYFEIPNGDYDGEDPEEEPEEIADNNDNGLTQERILEYLCTKIHSQSGNQEGEEEAEICVVCQSEFEEEEVMGCLDCGHEFHVECITTWLLQKNFCPICKRTAVPPAVAVAVAGGEVEIH